MNKFKVGDIVKFYDQNEVSKTQQIPRSFSNYTQEIERDFPNQIKHGQTTYRTDHPITVTFIIGDIVVVEYTSDLYNKTRLAFPKEHLILIKSKNRGKWANQKLRTLLETKNFNI